MENIVMMEDLSTFIAETIRAVSEGVGQARDGEIMVDAMLPDKIDFNILVVKRWQDLEIVRGENGQNTETQGGNTQETQTGTGNDTQTSTRKDLQNDERKTIESQGGSENNTRSENEQEVTNNAHNQTTESNYTYTDA